VRARPNCQQPNFSFHKRHARQLEKVLQRHLRDHGRIATRTDAYDRAGYREQLFGIERTIVRGHLERKANEQNKRKLKKRGEEEMSKQPRARTHFMLCACKLNTDGALSYKFSAALGMTFPLTKLKL